MDNSKWSCSQLDYEQSMYLIKNNYICHLDLSEKKMSTTIKEGLSYCKYYNGLSVYFFMMKISFQIGNKQENVIGYVNVKVLWIPSTKLLHDNFLYP